MWSPTLFNKSERIMNNYGNNLSFDKNEDS